MNALIMQKDLVFFTEVYLFSSVYCFIFLGVCFHTNAVKLSVCLQMNVTCNIMLLLSLHELSTRPFKNVVNVSHNYVRFSLTLTFKFLECPPDNRV